MRVIDISNINIPSSNRRLIPSWTNKRWILAPEYRDFKRILCLCCRKGHIEGPYRIVIDAHIKGKKDADNIVKSIFDALQMSGVISDDNKIVSFTVNKYPSDIEKLQVDVEGVAS